MDINKLNQLICDNDEGKVTGEIGRKRSENLVWETEDFEFCEALLDEECSVRFGNDTFQFVTGERDNEDYTWVAKHVESGTHYIWYGWYDSWEGCERDSDQAQSVVEEATRTVKYWKHV
jgi:hypothetical protein